MWVSGKWGQHTDFVLFPDQILSGSMLGGQLRRWENKIVQPESYLMILLTDTLYLSPLYCKHGLENWGGQSPVAQRGDEPQVNQCLVNNRASGYGSLPCFWQPESMWCEVGGKGILSPGPLLRYGATSLDATQIAAALWRSCVTVQCSPPSALLLPSS